MKKSIVLAVCIMVTMLFTSPTFCILYSEMQGQKGVCLGYFLEDGTQVTEQEWNDAVLRDLGEPTAAEYLAQQAAKSSATASPSQATSPTSSNTATTPKEKVSVAFTDAFGNVLGMSEVTKGTDIAPSQFVKDVPDCDGKSFDKWDYDGSVMMHDYVIRALYK